MSSTPPLHRESAVEQLTLAELEHEAARLNAETLRPEHRVYVEDRAVILNMGGPEWWFRILLRRVNNFYWMRDARSRLERPVAS